MTEFNNKAYLQKCLEEKRKMLAHLVMTDANDIRIDITTDAISRFVKALDSMEESV
tara:strand:- start:613 stop:780 length:168 start_codon:yes stop_codon:yes gene_type:complete